ncbi:glycosyltransferase family 4 protein [Flavobacterium sp.]|jgi:glycosyltransferase involved in cell wall biosynthesis|uniref:glycosyltransferase family 4 protein n=1 Tax=Flavobacterium sp. TaxID=239 RepID=UPI002A837B35|nr:glycosyltransferase family 4 protein [Flavobacterium sp.]
MKILFLALTFPKIGQSSNLYTDLMEEFRDQGHDVFVIAPMVDVRVGLLNEDGINIIRVKTLPLLNVNPIRKGIANVLLSFQYKKAIKKYFLQEDLDLILMPTPPISLVDVAVWLKKKYSSKLYLILRDIFPQNAVDLKMITKGGLLYDFFRKKEKKLYEESDFIGCMSRGNIDYVLNHNKDVQKQKLHLLQNWQKVMPLFDGDKAALRKKYNFDNKFVIIFGGNIGLPQKLENILEVAKLYNENDEVLFFIVGNGTEKQKIEQLCIQMKLNNVVIMNSLPREDYQNIIAVANAGLISLSEDFTIPNIPSKSLSYFNAKIPIIAAVDRNTDYGTIIQDEIGAGVWAVANEPIEIKQKIDYLRANKTVCNQMGEKGYQYFVDNVTPFHTYSTIKRVISV